MPAQLVIDAATAQRVTPMVEAVYAVRDLVNTPTEDMGPAELAGAVRALAERHGAEYREWVGDDLAGGEFPDHPRRRPRQPSRAAAGRTHARGRRRDPHLVLIGKGVCFDTGGLDLKTADGMRWMKKDMGGAAHAIALAGLVMRRSCRCG